MPPLPASPQAEGGADGARSGRVPCGQAVLSGGASESRGGFAAAGAPSPLPRLRGEAGRGAGERPPPYNSPMKKSDFHYELPLELIAQEPLPERSGSLMLVLPPGQAPPVDARIRQLGDWLRPGDLRVFNDTRVIPARLFGQKDTGGRVEILVERLLPGNRARVQLGVSKPPKPGARIALDAGCAAVVIAREGGFYDLRFEVDDALESWLFKAGRLPLPPYIRREPGRDDIERYQTVFAR